VSIVPDPSLVWLVGPSGSGKSTWAAAHFSDTEIVSSDRLRSIVGSGPNDLDASAAAFDILERIATARISAGLLTVIDTLGFDDELRQRLSADADQSGLPRIAVLFDTPDDVCRARNRSRDRSVPARVLAGQFKRYGAVRDQIEGSDWGVIRPDEIQVVGEPAIEIAAEAPAPSRDSTDLEFHLHISSFDWLETPDQLGDVFRAAETVGFSGVSVMDHLIQIPQVGRAWDDMLEPHIVLAHAAAVTERLRLGVLVTNVTLRPVAVLAKMLTTLDLLSGGRVDCGLGAGWFTREQVDRGIAFPGHGERLDLLADTIGALRAFWGPGGKPWSGSTLRLADTGMYPRPVQDRIPIIVGGGGERRTLRIVAEHADGCNLFTGPELAGKLAVLAKHCNTAERTLDDILVTALDVTITADDRSQLAALMERHRGNTPARDFRRRTSAGVVEDQIRRYRALRDSGIDRVYVSLIDLEGVDQVERFGRVIAAV
jgi:alkanesulfonate monooxygenase SsuD/methylene tetrahydromethanopterin reductase-like flavin-dependent oxidoreductase (luciferase family)/predicted kinase